MNGPCLALELQWLQTQKQRTQVFFEKHPQLTDAEMRAWALRAQVILPIKGPQIGAIGLRRILSPSSRFTDALNEAQQMIFEVTRRPSKPFLIAGSDDVAQALIEGHEALGKRVTVESLDKPTRTPPTTEEKK